MVQDYQDLTTIDVDAEAEHEVGVPKGLVSHAPTAFGAFPEAAPVAPAHFPPARGKGGPPLLNPRQSSPPKLPPSHRWKQPACSGRHMVLILLGLSAILLIASAAFGVKGSTSSSQLWGTKDALASLNQTVVAEMAALRGKGQDTEAKLTKVDTTVKQLNEEGEAAKTRLLIQLATLRKSLRLLKCDLENFQQNRTESPETCCPSGWAQFRKNCYLDSNEAKSWEDAKADCEDRDAHLLIVNSYEEQLFVAVRVRPRFVWIGLTDAGGSWKWVDGTPYTVRPEDWMPEQPDDWYGHGLGGGEDCAHLHSDGHWNDDHCSRHYGWVCEMEGKE